MAPLGVSPIRHTDAITPGVRVGLHRSAPPRITDTASPCIPPNAGRLSAPLGYYMIFLLTNTGVPSVAHFVRFQ